jgi:hypothetical protein
MHHLRPYRFPAFRTCSRHSGEYFLEFGGSQDQEPRRSPRQRQAVQEREKGGSMNTLKIINSLVNLDSKIERKVATVEDYVERRSTIISFFVMAILALFFVWVCK